MVQKSELQNKILWTLLLVLISNYPIVTGHFLEDDAKTLPRCGGPIETDSGSLQFSSSDLPSAEDTLCLWTIYLPSTSTFRLSFSDFNVTGYTENCEDNGVRLYPLNNLSPSDRFEGVTFCSNKPPTAASFYLPESVIAVVYHSSQVNGTNLSSHFTLNWEGLAPQPTPKTYESTYSTASSSSFRYPPLVVGEYPPNLVSTWVVQANLANQTRQTMQVRLANINTEPCSRGAAQDCLCDALVLYQVKRDGTLEESRRLCGNVTAQTVNKFSTNFILALFTDNEDVEGDGTGFEVTYSPTVQPPVSNVSRSCGGIVSGTSGLIEYKPGVKLDYEERCLWTIRSPSRTQIKLTVNQIGLEAWSDYMEVLGMSSTGNKTQFSFVRGDIGRTVTFNATVAVLSLFTWYIGSGTGFSISFEAEGPIDSKIGVYNDFFYNMGNDSCGGAIQYTLDDGGSHQPEDMELSSFVIQHTYSSKAIYKPLTLNVTGLNLRRNPETGNCTDMIRAFWVQSLGLVSSYSVLEEIGYGKPIGVCQMDMVDHSWGYYLHSNYAAVIFLLTDVNNGNTTNLKSIIAEDQGFEVGWEVGFNEPGVCHW